jgi:pimeloyl-ACP methyl ester carboxylesterase
MSRVFVPGFGALAGFYRPALAADWIVHEPPSFRRAASFRARVQVLREQLERLDGPVTLAGHSMGAALAVTVALEHPERIERLVLVGPAGLPLTKPMRASVNDFFGQVGERVYSPRELARVLVSALAAPRSTLDLARAVRALDLRQQLEAVSRRGIRTEVVGCVGDTLTPVDHCKRIARLAGARYREVDVRGGHMWMLFEPAAFAAVLAR